jgi:hypothetical protein
MTLSVLLLENQESDIDSDIDSEVDLGILSDRIEHDEETLQLSNREETVKNCEETLELFPTEAASSWKTWSPAALKTPVSSVLAKKKNKCQRGSKFF